MKKNKNLTLLVGIVACVIFLFTVTVYVIYHIDYEDERAEIQQLEKELEKSNVRFDELRKVADEVTTRYNETSGQEQEIQLLKDKVEFLVEAFGMSHVNENDPDWECKKWVGMVELAKQDYPNFVEDTLLMAEKKCGFDVNNITP